MRKSDIQIYPFLPVRFHHLANKANYRNHRKIAVVDGEVGFVGGLNIADRYMDGVPGIGIWRDTHLKVTGEVVTSLQVIFLIDWYFVRQELLLDKNEYLPYHQADNNVIVQTVTSGPDSDWASIQQSYFYADQYGETICFYFDTLFYARRDDIEFLEDGCDERGGCQIAVAS